MGVYIKGMKMPKDEPIRIVLNPNGQLFVDHGVHFTEYEAVELPPHGRLIDRDALNKDIDKAECYNFLLGGFQYDPFVTHMSECINDAPTIIEAEDGT